MIHKLLTLFFTIIALALPGLIKYKIDNGTLNEDFFIFLINFFSYFSLKIILPLMLLPLAIPLLYKPKSLLEYRIHLQFIAVDKIIVLAAILGSLSILAVYTSNYRNINNITYIFKQNNQDYMCNYNIRTQILIGENAKNKCETTLVDGVKKLQTMQNLQNEKNTDNENVFLHLIIKYQRQNKIEIIPQAKKNAYEKYNDIYVKDPQDFLLLIAKSLRKDKE